MLDWEDPDLGLLSLLCPVPLLANKQIHASSAAWTKVLVLMVYFGKSCAYQCSSMQEAPSHVIYVQ